jgi:nicotinate phosphoribosyltransferase
MSPSGSEEPLGLWCDLGLLSQAAIAFVHDRHQTPSHFEFSISTLPAHRNYLIFAGLETLLRRLDRYGFASEQIEYLRHHPAFAAVPLLWFEHLSKLRFEGDVTSMPEGTIFWAPAPVLRITAPFDVGSLISSLVMGTLTRQIAVASKVSRLLTAVSGRMLIEAAVGHANNPSDALSITRAAYLAGTLTTTNSQAARLLKLPTHSLMHDAWSMLCQNESEVCHQNSSAFGTMNIPIIYSPESLHRVRRSITSGASLQAICIDNIDLHAFSIEARRMLDQAGRKHAKIIASGQLNEEKIARLIEQGSPIDGFAVGTSLATQDDSPILKSVYKLVAHQSSDGNWKPVSNNIVGKRSYPWAKQVMRRCNDDGSFAEDLITKVDEETSGEPLLTQVMKDGKHCIRLPSLEECRDYCMMQRVRLPEELLELLPAKHAYPVHYSEALENDMKRLSHST